MNQNDPSLWRSHREPKTTEVSNVAAAQSGSKPVVPGDNPIRRAEDDGLGRSPLARRFAQQVLLLDSSEGVVVGVLGPWGSGKTSFINLARLEFENEQIPVLDFNPWMFSGTEHLVESFFRELSAQLRLKPALSELGDRLADYGDALSGMAWLPLVGTWIERTRLAARVVLTALRRRKSGIGERRSRLTAALKALHNPIVVVIDDIDRLTTAEIRHIFQLVRLTASFPNLIYIVAFDRERVEQALGETGVPGRDYLEKILQVAVDLPSVSAQLLSKQLFASIDKVIASVGNVGRFDQDLWPDVFAEIIRPLLRNMRDVRRYAASVHASLDLANQVALVDLLALEAIRTFLPDVFAALYKSVLGLTTPSGGGAWGRDEPAFLKAQVNDLVQAAGDHAGVVESLINRLFPAAQRHLGGTAYGSDWTYRWLRERRVAHESVLRLYLERYMGDDLRAFTLAEHAWTLMADQAKLDAFLRSLDPNLWEDVISSLEAFEEEFTSGHVVPATVVLFNLLPDMPERQRGMFEYDARIVVSRVTYRLLRSLGRPDAIRRAVEEIYPHLTTLSSKLELITDVGYRENAGHKLVSEEAARQLELRWRQDVRDSIGADLRAEWDLLRVLYLAKTEAGPSEEPLEIPDSGQVTLALLRSARSEVRSQSVNSRAVRRSPRLAWSTLVELFGDEAELRRRIEGLRSNAQADSAELVELATRYLSGWRPEKF